jgi:hypothetical protein
MADGVVNIIFQADSSSTTKAFATLNSEMAGASGSTVNWTKLTKESAQAQEFMRGTVGKTAADFKAATAAQREASVATGEASQSMGKLAGQVGLAYLAYRALHAAVDAVKYVVTESASLETASVRFSNLAGNTKEATAAFEGLKAVAKETNINITELAPAATTMLEAGIPLAKIDETMVSIGNKANVAGSSVAELSDIYLRLESKGDISGRQLAMLSKVTGDQTGSLSAMYKDMTITIPLIAKEMERVQRATERTRQDSERLLNTQNAFLEKHGAQAGIEAAFKAQSGQGMAPYVKVAGMENVGGMGQGAVKADWKYLQEGMKQLGAEEHISAQAMQGLVQSGAIGMDEVRDAAKRAHEQQDITRQRANQDATTALEVRKEHERLKIASQAAAGLLPSTTPAVVAKEAEQTKNVEATQEYHLRAVGNEVRDAAQNAGDGLRILSKGIDALTKSLTGYDAAAHPVKGMQPAAPYTPSGKPGGPNTDWGAYVPSGIPAPPTKGGMGPTSLYVPSGIPGGPKTDWSKQPDVKGLGAGLTSGGLPSEKRISDLQERLQKAYPKGEFDSLPNTLHKPPEPYDVTKPGPSGVAAGSVAGDLWSMGKVQGAGMSIGAGAAQFAGMTPGATGSQLMKEQIAMRSYEQESTIGSRSTQQIQQLGISPSAVGQGKEKEAGVDSKSIISAIDKQTETLLKIFGSS